MTKLWALGAFALLALVAGGTGGADEPFGRLGVDDVAARIGKPGVYVYDNNAKEVFAAGHVPTAKWVAFDAVQASNLPSDKKATLIFYCANEH
jgi:hypothetical protein